MLGALINSISLKGPLHLSIEHTNLNIDIMEFIRHFVNKHPGRFGIHKMVPRHFRDRHFLDGHFLDGHVLDY